METKTINPEESEQDNSSLKFSFEELEDATDEVLVNDEINKSNYPSEKNTDEFSGKKSQTISRNIAGSTSQGISKLLSTSLEDKQFAERWVAILKYGIEGQIKK